jgi:spermidine synthase
MERFHFPSMSTLIPPGKLGCAEVSHWGKYAVLKINGTTVMSDTGMERITNQDVVDKARGQVLIAGLGLGMILHPIAAKASVQKILVVEQSADVIKLIEPTLPANITLVCVDIFDWKPFDWKWDTIYFDIWPDISQDNLAEMSKLHRKFRSKLAPGGWMGSWCRKHLQAQRRRIKGAQ